MSAVKTFLDSQNIGVEQKHKLNFFLPLFFLIKKRKNYLLVKFMISISSEKVQVSLWVIQSYQCFISLKVKSRTCKKGGIMNPIS